MSDKDNELQFVIDEATNQIESAEPKAEPNESSESGEQIEVDGTELSAGEVELAKKHGLIKEGQDNELQKQQKADTKKDDGKKEEVEEPTFEDVEKNEKLLEKYNKNEKALYWKYKTDKHKRQEAQERVKELEDKLKEAVDSGVSGKKLDKIKELLKTPDSLTIEALQGALEEHIEPEKLEELNNADVIQQKILVKQNFAEKIGLSRYENFGDITKLAKEVITNDGSGTFQKIINESFTDDNVDENMLVDRVVNIARMNPKFKDIFNQVKPEDKQKVDRVLENSKKKVSSASVNGASGRRIVSESELTAEQALRLPKNQWDKLRSETRQRILKQVS